MNDSSCSKMIILKFLIYISSRHDVEIRPNENFHQHFGSTNESRGLSGNCCFWYNSQTYQSARKNDGRQQGSNSHLKHLSMTSYCKHDLYTFLLRKWLWRMCQRLRLAASPIWRQDCFLLRINLFTFKLEFVRKRKQEI